MSVELKDNLQQAIYAHFSKLTNTEVKALIEKNHYDFCESLGVLSTEGKAA
ncbi:MAG: hypothetical protein GX667_08475 [Xanthomonadaceae bacterium]|nr:hypothetical protein [Xanthomonadaceae bacterium]